MATRKKRGEKSVEATYYAVSENTDLQNTTLRHFTNQEKTKQKLSVYLANQFINTYEDAKIVYITLYMKHDILTIITMSNNIVKLDEWTMIW